jgi:DNA repair protein SbcC/Rad50
MRPLRLLLDGFGCYRQPAEADFTDVEFFALVGPTGSGKSTVIDGLCFALYGTVPRWGKENAIADALAPAANGCRVCLVFEVGGKRYAAVRALNRDKQGRVHTKEARLELLDAAVEPGAPISALLEASVDQIAEGPALVTAGVEELLGLSYQHFIQSVLLPQGRFSRFLQAKASERQKLLVELLAFGVYEKVGQRARERARVAAERAGHAQRERGKLAGATPDAEAAAANRLAALAALAATVDDTLAGLRELAERAGQAAEQAKQGREETALLAKVRTPAEVAGLADRISQADKLFSERRCQLDEAERLAAEAGQHREGLPDQAAAERIRDAYTDQRELAGELADQEKELAAAQAAEQDSAAALRAAEEELERAQRAVQQTERAHAAAALTQTLAVGEDCPVCLREVTALPHHPAPAGLVEAKSGAQAADRQRKRATETHRRAERDAVAAAAAVAGTRPRLDKCAAYLAKAPAEADVAASLTAIAEAEAALRIARRDAATAKTAFGEAERARAALTDEEKEAWARLRAARDSVVPLGAPVLEDNHLVTSWTALTTWAAEQNSRRAQHQSELDTQATALRKQVVEGTAELTKLLAGHGISGVTDPTRAAAAVATHTARAETELAAIRQAIKKAAELDGEIRAARDEEQVAAMLGRLLQARKFEGWLCSEALDSLVAEASVTLMELSGDQYQLDRDDRNELVVIDYADAGARRPVHTLSGGETFQASLALALALSRQVAGLSGGVRDLNSMFLDEGFGTLDADTLETVAITLERLAADSDRMVGIVTHVPELAERVPVRFVVSRSGSGSALRKERVG